MKTNLTPEAETPDLKLLPNTMTYDFIRMLVDNYRNNQLKSVNEKLGIEDAHSIHFDLATLKKFIADIESLSLTGNPGLNTDNLGVRFYYAAYPKAADWHLMGNTPIGVDYAEKHTLVMVPTIKRKDENGVFLCYDFNLLDMKIKEKNASAFKKDSDTSIEFVCQNHGTLSPPATKVTELF